MIENDIEDIIKVLKKKALQVKKIFYGLTFTILVIFILITLNMISLIPGAVIVIFLLFIVLMIYTTINSYNNDVQSLKKNELKSLEGDILAVFKSEDSIENTWKIYVNSGNKEYISFEIGEKISKNLTEGDIVNIVYTPNNKIIVSLKMVRKTVNIYRTR